MSYNIDTIKFLNGELSISQADFLALFEEVHDDIPEDSLFHRDDVELIQFKTKRADGKTAQAVAGEDCPDPIVFSPDSKQPWKTGLRWRACWSGNSYDTFKRVLSKMKGEAELIVIWEGGDSVNGLRIKDGQVTEHKIKYVLED